VRLADSRAEEHCIWLTVQCAKVIRSMAARMGVDHGGQGGTSPPRIWSGGR